MQNKNVLKPTFLFCILEAVDILPLVGIATND